MDSRSVSVRLRAVASLDGRRPGRTAGSGPAGADSTGASETAPGAAAPTLPDVYTLVQSLTSEESHR